MIYLDYNATAPVLPEVKAAMEPFLAQAWGNPSSNHRMGREAKLALQAARKSVAALIGADPTGIVFTSGATESNNTALFSAFHGRPGGTILTTTVEHSSVLAPSAALKANGTQISEIPVSKTGQLDLETFERRLPGTTLASVMWVNNETGVIFPIEDIAKLCHRNGVLLHVDAVQAAGKLLINLDHLPHIDYLSISAHKMGGPKGVGALYVRSGAPFRPLLFGGDQESSRRPGTENLASIVGMGAAARTAALRTPVSERVVAPLRDHFEKTILERVNGSQINGLQSGRVHNTTNIAFPVEDAEGLLLVLDNRGVFASTGSACHAASLQPSHVLLAMGFDRNRAKRSVRFSLGFETTLDELNEAAEIVADSVLQLKAEQTFVR